MYDLSGTLLAIKDGPVPIAFLKLAKEVNNTKMEIHLEPMSPYDRRLIHNALTDFKGIKTESEGEGQDRHIVIKPV